MATRKKPGRPRKHVDACPVGSPGIVNEPSVPGNCVEFVYNQPQLLKCIVSIFKEYDSDEVIIEFHPDRVVFTGKDHSLCVDIYIVINAADMNLYYYTPPRGTASYSGNVEQSRAPSDGNAPHMTSVEPVKRPSIGKVFTVDEDDDPDCPAAKNIQQSVPVACAHEPLGHVFSETPTPPYRIVVKRDNLEIVSSIIEKTHYKMMMVLHHDDLSSLFITLNNCDYDSEDCFEIASAGGCSSTCGIFSKPIRCFR